MTEFKITGPGEYRTRDGRKIFLLRCKPLTHPLGYPWLSDEDQGDCYYADNGVPRRGGMQPVIGAWPRCDIEYKGIVNSSDKVLTWLDFVNVMTTPMPPAKPKCEKCGAEKTVVGGTIRADGGVERTDYACLDCNRAEKRKFKITGPGEYRTRDGRKAVVKGNNNGGSYCWQGKIGEEYYDWTEYGSYWNKGIISINDIIGPWEEPATVITVLDYKGITKKPSDVLTWLDFVTIMNDPASVISGSPKAEKRSEDEAHGNTACAEAGSDVAGSAKWAVDEVLSFCIDNAENVSVYKTGLAKELVKALKMRGFVIVRLKDTRNGCYNTRTEKDVD